jgi:tetratricopeptide (TPR) repeat protein
MGRLREAQLRLEQALQLNTNNLSARISLACNTNLQAGTTFGLSDVGTLASHLGNLDRLKAIMSLGGPFDLPDWDYLLGSLFLDNGNLVQAAEQLERVRVLVPGSLAPELALAEIYNRMQLTSRGRPVINHLKEESRRLPANSSLDLNLALLDSYSWLLQTNVAKARDALQAVVAKHPDDPQINSRVFKAYLAMGDLTNALRLADAQLARMPDDAASLNDKAAVLMQLSRPSEAVTLLDRVLTLTNQPAARMNRALANIANEDLAAAESDLHALEKGGEDPAMVNFGFALVAQHNHDTNQALHFLQLSLTNTPQGSALWQQAGRHMRMLQPGAAAPPKPELNP